MYLSLKLCTNSVDPELSKLFLFHICSYRIYILFFFLNDTVNLYANSVDPELQKKKKSQFAAPRIYILFFFFFFFF